jgi:hypothetical protein
MVAVRFKAAILSYLSGFSNRSGARRPAALVSVLSGNVKASRLSIGERTARIRLDVGLDAGLDVGSDVALDAGPWRG